MTTFSAQNVEPTSYFPGSGKYFAKTDKDGWSLPRSTKQKQFVYQYDTTCEGKKTDFINVRDNLSNLSNSQHLEII